MRFSTKYVIVVIVSDNGETPLYEIEVRLSYISFFQELMHLTTLTYFITLSYVIIVVEFEIYLQ